MTLATQLPPLAPFAAPRPFDQHAGIADNGLRIYAIRQAAAPLVTVQLDIPFGVDSPEQTGVAELLAATLCTGTSDLDRSRIEDELALVGGALRCSVNPERLTLSVTVLADGLASTLAIIAQCLGDARYPESELVRERTRLTERVKLAYSTPGLLARQLMYRHCFADHPVSRQIPEIEHVLAADAEAVRILHDRKVVPDGATLLLVGDIEPALAVDAAASAFDGWRADHPASRLAALPTMAADQAVEVIERPELRHAAVRMAARSVGRADPRCAPLYLANLLLGGYFSSRLNLNLRERDGFVYGVQSLLLEHAGVGITVIEFDTAAGTADKALDRALADITELATDGPSPDEVDRARRYATGAMSLYLTTREGIVDHVGKVLAAGLEPGWVLEHHLGISQASDADVAAAARDFLVPERFTNLIITKRQ